MTLLTCIRSLKPETSELILSLYTLEEIKEFDQALRKWNIQLGSSQTDAACLRVGWRCGHLSGYLELWFGTHCYLFLALWSGAPRHAPIVKRPGRPLADRWIDLLMGDRVPWDPGGPVPFRDGYGKVTLRQ